MTSLTGSGQILKTDALTRVRTPPERRAQLLDEFEQSGLSAVKFAAVVGVKYQTFAGWVAQRKRRGQSGLPPGKTPPVRWVEAVLDQASNHPCQNPGLTVRLKSGAQVEIRHAGQIGLAAALLQALEKVSPPC